MNRYETEERRHEVEGGDVSFGNKMGDKEWQSAVVAWDNYLHDVYRTCYAIRVSCDLISEIVI